MSSANSLARQSTRLTKGPALDVEESSDSNESTPDRELERARVLENKGNSIHSRGSSGSSRPKSIDLLLQGVVIPAAKDARRRLITTNPRKSVT